MSVRCCWGVGGSRERLTKQGDREAHLPHTRSKESLGGWQLVNLLTLPPAQGPLITPLPGGGQEAL